MRLFSVLLSSVLCAALPLLAGWLLTTARPVAQDGPALLRVAAAHDARLTRKLLDQACERDVQLERLLIELSAGALETDAARQSQQLTRLLGGKVRLFVQRGPRLSELSRAASHETALELGTLEQAARARGVLQGESPVLLDACVAARGATRLWVTRSIAVSQLVHEAGLDALGYELREVSAGGAANADELLLPTLPAGKSLRLRPHQLPSSDGDWFAYLLALGAAGALTGALLGVWLTRAQQVDEAVLTAIETATARVAQGDLSSQISLSVSGRADQTLRSFDRMTQELRETRAKLREAERAAAWQDMAQRIAHEIKNPLSPIKLALETLRKAHDKRLSAFDEIFEESTRAMLEEVARMEHIVREFSDFARLPRARPGALELTRLVQETIGLYAPAGVHLTLQAPDHELHLHADREQLVQVVVNLLANAGDAARENPAPRVEVSVLREQRRVLLRVDDNGPGVAPSARERIFEPYVTSKPQGTGLGLAIVRRIVEDHGGKIEVRDSPLGGARFELAFSEGGAEEKRPLLV